MKNVESQLKKIIGEYHTRYPIGLLYSGGLDSSIIGKIMLSIFPSSSIIAVCVGLPKSYDLNNALTNAKELGIKVSTRFFTIENIIETMKSLRELKCTHGPGDLSLAIPLFLGMQTLAKEFQVQTVFLGQGADELFGGYQKYVHFLKEFGPEATNKAMTDDFRKLKEKQLIMERKIAQNFNLSLCYPFLDPFIINFAQSQPVTVHIVRNSQGRHIRKVLLRNLAKRIGLPEIITSQQKKAIQYGSGAVKILRKLAKSYGYRNIPDWYHDFFKED